MPPLWRLAARRPLEKSATWETRYIGSPCTFPVSIIAHSITIRYIPIWHRQSLLAVTRQQLSDTRDL
jgi:hypothetical protein